MDLPLVPAPDYVYQSDGDDANQDPGPDKNGSCDQCPIFLLKEIPRRNKKGYIKKWEYEITVMEDPVSEPGECFHGMAYFSATKPAKLCHLKNVSQEWNPASIKS